MYKFVAIDLDGTLLNDYGEISKETKDMLEKEIKKGTEIVFASGRSITSIKNLAETIDGIKYIISGDGAIVYNLDREEIIYENCLSKLKALNLIQICKENSITYSVYTDKAIIADNLKYNVLYYYKENLKKEENKKTKIKIVKDTYEYIKNIQDEHILNVSICDDEKSVFNSVLNKLNAANDVEVLEVSHMSRKIIKNGTECVPLEYYYTEISNKHVNKWNAIKFLLEYLNINENEVIAIGDNANDEEMIKCAGLGIAMKGSTPKILEAADYITEYNNNEEGAKKALEKFLEKP